MSSLKVLLVDDEPATLQIVRRYLDDYEVHTTGDGREALEKFEEDPYAYRIIVTDLFMPGMDGFDLIVALRNRFPYVYPYIIVLSARGEEEAIVRALELGADDFLEKPVSKKKLLAYFSSGLRKLTWSTLDVLLDLPLKFIELQDGYTGKHVRDVRILAFLLARAYSERYGVDDPRFAERLKLASAFHDIGKIVIPTDILKKPGPYTAEERKIIESHTTYGASVLEDAVVRHPENEILRTCYEVVLYHHERWDGSGYPFGLKGEEIPLSARIVAVADVFNALTSDRHYRSAYSLDRALEIMESERERFDPRVFSLLCEYRKLVGAVKRKNC
ncbi:MAG: HD-GYP domain-containing protein [Candidatus Caldatribacteriaceae bacterium]